MNRVPNQITADTSKCSGAVTIQASEQETEDLVSQFAEIFQLLQEEEEDEQDSGSSKTAP